MTIKDLEPEDIGSIIVFIDNFLPFLDKTDEGTRDTAKNVFNAREKLHRALGPAGSFLPKGVNPLESV